MALEPGQIVTIHSLQSEGGKKLNGKKGILIRKVKDDQNRPRFEIKVKGNKPIDSTSAIKPANLEIVPKLSLPQEGSRPRGYVEGVPSDEQCPILAELLVMHHEDYEPPKTQLTGFPAMAFSELGQYNFTSFTAMQMEWIAATYALGDIIKREGARGCEDVVFALLEGDPMYLDTLIITMTNTPFIGSEEKTKEKVLLFQEFRDARTQLTPDQDDYAYIKALKIGPLFILHQVGKYKFGTALFAAMRKSKVFPLLIQRLLRLVGREGLGNEDGKELGPMCREILPKLCKGYMPDTIEDMFKEGPMAPDGAAKLLDHVSEFDEIENFQGAFKSTLGALSHGVTVSKYLSMLNRRK